MQLPKWRYEEITTIIIDMFKRYDVTTIPIDCYELATKLGIVLKPYSLLSPDILENATSISEDGFCLFNSSSGPFSFGQWYIFFNDAMPPKRVRFTIMHEIGHIVLDHIEPSDLSETEANFFAKYALAPPPLVHKVHPEDYLELGDYFDLSNEFAMNSFSYYKKWLKYGGEFYKEKELELIELFRKDINLQ